MDAELRRKARKRLDERLSTLKPIDRFRNPPKGWIRAIRDAIGMSGTQLGRRLGISPQSVDAIEKSEANGTIKIETLRRAAEAVDCTLVYALVPNASLQQAVETRARTIALRDLNRVGHTMKLEAQEVGNGEIEEQIEDYIRQYVRDRDLWELP